MTTTQSGTTGEWGGDVWGTINDFPSEVTEQFIETLEYARTEPGFLEARRSLLQDLALAPGRTVLEGGSGTGAALPDVLDVLGREGHMLGVDPTVAFVEAARRRAATLNAPNARYEVGDIRALPAEAGRFDAAFCDKILIHAGPGPVAVGELARVVRPGGKVGAVEWTVAPAISTNHPELVARLNGFLPQSAYDFAACANLARYFHAAGLTDVRRRVFTGRADSLDGHPFWRSLLQAFVPGAVGMGLLSEAEAQTLLGDWDELSRRGEFSLVTVIQTAVGTKPA